MPSEQQAVRLIRQSIRVWWKHLLLILFIIFWYLLTNFFLTAADKIVSALGYAVVFPCLIWMLITSIFIRHKQQLIARFHRKPGSKPFEYLFLIFLFFASYYVTYLFSIDIGSNILKFLEIWFMMFFLVFGAFSFGWLHYMERIEGQTLQQPPENQQPPQQLENHPCINNPQDGISRDTVYTQMYEEGRYFRQHELTVSTWYSAFLIAIIAAIFVFKTSTINNSDFYSQIRIPLLIVVIFIGISSVYSVFYSGIRYKEIRNFLNDNLEPAYSRSIRLTSWTFNPRQIIIFILIILTIVTAAVVMIA